MSKKTRQQKIIADLRRQLNQNQTPSYSLAQINSAPTEKTKSQSPTPDQHAIADAPSSAYIKKDLTKTLILTILAISFELVLYFLGRAGKL